MLTELARKIKHLRSPLNTWLGIHYKVRVQFLLMVMYIKRVEGGGNGN